jgi:beta-catenin-like protein 1
VGGSTDIKRPKIASKGKQRAEDSFEYSQTWNAEEDEEGGRFFGDGLTSEQKEIIDILNQDMEDENDAPHEASAGAEKIKLTEIKKNCLNLERAINKNREQRTKYADQPEK